MQQALLKFDIAPTVEALRYKLQTLARAEYQRRRRHLGQLAPEQERAVEELLRCTVNKICHPLTHLMQWSYDTDKAENLQAWREVFGLED